MRRAGYGAGSWLEASISTDGKGSWRDEVPIERFWQSLKHEHVCLHAYDNLRIVREGIGAYIEYDNHQRQISSLGECRPCRCRSRSYLVAHCRLRLRLA